MGKTEGQQEEVGEMPRGRFSAPCLAEMIRGQEARAQTQQRPLAVAALTTAELQILQQPLVLGKRR